MSNGDHERNAMGFSRKHTFPALVLGFTLTAALGCWIQVLPYLLTRQTAPKAALTRSVPDKPQPKLSDLPLRFEPNVGQTADGYDFISRTPGATLFTRPTEATL